MSRCAQQMVWIQTWLDEVEITHDLPGIIRGDSRGAIALSKTTKDHGKVKHIDIRHHFLRELVKSGVILFEQIPSTDNLADLFTKPLARDHHHRFLSALNIQWGSYVHGGVLKGDRIPVLFLCPIPEYPLFRLSYHSIFPFMVISFIYVMSYDTYSDYFIYDDTTSDHSQLSLPRPTESESNISIYLIIYLFTIPCSSYL